MYYIDQRYRAFYEKDLFATYEEAVAHAHDTAGEDYEGYYFVVSEIKAVVKSEKPVLPTKITEVTGENIKAIISQKDGDEDTISIPNL